MNLDFIKNSFKFIFLLSIFSFVSIGVVWVYNFKAIDNYLYSEEHKVSDSMQRVNLHVHEISDILFDNIINTKEVIDIFKDAHTADVDTKEIIRKKLYNHLKQKYSSFKDYNIKLLHFHLPNLDSFLRFHKPEIYGDDIASTRETVAYVAKNKKSTYSFEEGKIYSGFRYVYPLFYKDEYIGSVEISHTSQSFQNMFQDKFDHNIDIVVRRDVVEAKVFKNQLDNYYDYILNNNFLVQHDMKISNNSLSLWKKLMKDKDVISNMNAMKQFSTYVYHTEESHYHVVSFIPIKNLLTGKKVAYSIVSEPSEFLDTIIFNFEMQVLISIFVSVLLASIVYKEVNARNKMKRLLRKLSEFSKKNRVIFNLSNDMIVTMKDGVIQDVNKKFLSFYQKEDIYNLGTIKDNVENIFLHEDGCFSVNSSKTDDFWVDEILKLDDENRVVCILDKNINKSFFHLYISILDEKTNEYLLSFKEVTQIRRKHQQLEKQAYYDNLTQVYNRHYFMEKFSQSYVDLQLSNISYSLIMFDVDHFKEVNDVYGHDVGDNTLVFLAEIIKKSIREDDIFARWGGEEFMLMANANLKSAIKIAENLRINIEKLTKEHEDIPDLTCSFGVVVMNEYKSTTDILKAVDTKLYKAKHMGRNIVIH